MAGISTFGGAPQVSGGDGGNGGGSVVDPMVIGQVIQAAGGLDLLPADGRLLERSLYPLAYTALQNDSNEVNTLQANTSYTAEPMRGNIAGVHLKAGDLTAFMGNNGVMVSNDGGQTWTTSPYPTDPQGGTNAWRNLSASDTHFCLIGDRYSAISTDGVNWTLSNPLPVVITSSFGSGTFFFCGERFTYSGQLSTSAYPMPHYNGGSTTISSVDGLNWEHRDGIPLSLVNRVIPLANGKYFAYGLTTLRQAATDRVATSDDGVNWTVRTLPSAEIFLGAAATDSTIVMLTAAKIFTSTDAGLTWTVTLMSAVVTNPFTSIAGITSFVGTHGTFLLSLPTLGLYKSADGINWTLLTAANSVASTSHNTFATDGADTFVIAMSARLILVSKDRGATWKAVNPLNTSTVLWNCVIWTGTQFILLHNASTTSLKSADGLVWTVASTTVPAMAAQASLYSYNATLGYHFLLPAGVATTQCMTSNDGGITWVMRALPASVICYGIASQGGKTIVSNASGANVAVSTNGTTFATATAAGAGGFQIAASPTMFVRSAFMTAATTAAHNLSTSPDGVTWTPRTIAAVPTGWWPTAIVWTGTQFVIISPSTNSMATSPDGITWTYVTNVFNGKLFSNAADNGNRPMVMNTNAIAFISRGGVNVANSEFTLNISGNDLNGWTQSGQLARGSAGGFIFGGRTTVGGGPEVFGLDGPFMARYVDGASAIEFSVLPFPTANAQSFSTIRTVEGKYFAVANFFTNASFRSLDGINWTKLSVVAFANDIGYVNDTLTIVQNSNLHSSPDDGDTWVRHDLPIYAETVARVIGGNGVDRLFILHPNVTGASLTVTNQQYHASFDGLKVRSSVPFIGNHGASTQMFGGTVAFARKENFAVVGYCGMTTHTPLLSYTQDGGDTWTQISAPSGCNPASIAYNEELDLFVMMHGGSTTLSQHNLVYKSKDGIKWMAHNMPSAQYWNTVVSFGKLFIAISGASNVNGTVFAFSTNGINWTQFSAPIGAYWGNGTVTHKAAIFGVQAGAGYQAVIGKFYDPETHFQLPAFTSAFGQPGWFVKVK